MSVGLLKMYSETALIDTIKRENNTITVTFTLEGTRRYPLPEVFKALKDIPMKTDMQAEGRLSIDFKVPKRMHEDIWLDALVKFAKLSAAYRVERDEKESEQETQEESEE